MQEPVFCRHCGRRLTPGGAVCAACGFDNGPPAASRKKETGIGPVAGWPVAVAGESVSRSRHVMRVPLCDKRFSRERQNG